MSDHAAITTYLRIKKPKFPQKTIKFRQYSKIDIQALKNDIANSELTRTPCANMNEYVEQYNTVLGHLLDKYAPEKTKTIVDRPKVPWVNPDFFEAKMKRRKSENIWRRNKSDQNRQNYNRARNDVVKTKDKAKKDHYSNEIENCQSDQKKLFAILNEILCNKQSEKLPEHESSLTLANQFSSFFVDKIEQIRSTLSNTECVYNPIPEPEPNQLLDNFSEIETKEVEKVIKSLSNATCILDPLPTTILKCCLDSLLPIITTITNMSLTTGEFPEALKEAIIRPRLKKQNLDINTLKNYRPVSNISFLSKVIEKCAINQLTKHMDNNNLHEPFQSAYRAGFSTETALVRIANDVLCELDNRRGVILVLLDLSAAFDTIDHNILQERLRARVGVRGTALLWFETYHTGRSQRVSVGNSMSNAVTLKYGGPQGSLIGAEDYKVYTLPVGDIIRKHQLKFKIYADDTQLHISFTLNDEYDLHIAISKIEACVREIKEWMTLNLLKLNTEKTEVLVITPKNAHAKVESINVDSSTVVPAKSAKNIGVIFDNTLSMHEHVSYICKSCMFHLRNIAAIRRYITQDACESIIHAMITSRMDYANATLLGLPQYELRRLQKIQNIAARIIFQQPRYEHVTPLLRSLHWLPIEKRIIFKTLILTFKCIHKQAPAYLQELISIHQPPRTLRSGQGKMLLSVPKSRTVRFGQRAFRYKGPSLWNNLPIELRCENSFEKFKKLLKTHLFSTAY